MAAGPRQRLWITRTSPGAERTAAAVRALGFEALGEPLLETRPIAAAAVDLKGVGALAFTSVNAVRAFAALTTDRAPPVFAVGETTAKAARQAGFTAVEYGAGDVEALAALIIARRGAVRGPVLYAAAAQPSRDLAAALRNAGVAVREVAVYETAARTPAPEFLTALGRIDGVLLHSAKAARALTALLANHPAPHLVAYCLSAQVAQPLAGADLAATCIAAQPKEAALLALLSKGD